MILERAMSKRARDGDMSKFTLNIGCGGKPNHRAYTFGDIRIDIIPFRNITARMDAHHLALKDNLFDETYCFEVLEHLTSPIIALKEMRRTLKQNGKILLTIPNLWNWRRILRGILKRISISRIDHKQGWDILELANLAHQAGLKIREYGWLDWYPKRMLRLLDIFDKFIPTPFSKTHMYAVLEAEES